VVCCSADSAATNWSMVVRRDGLVLEPDVYWSMSALKVNDESRTLKQRQEDGMKGVRSGKYHV
jgi:hypothetical protein